MPELPECEANRRRIEDGALNRTIEAVRLGNDTAHVDLPKPGDRERLVGRQFTEARRHGKAIFAGSATGPWIVVSLGMTGSLRTHEAADGTPDHTRITVEFEGGRRLSFRCPRKLGSVEVIDDPDDWIAAARLGPDAWTVSGEDFAARVGGGRGAIKSALMDQKKIAGIGNLWSDETLFRAGIAPQSRADALPDGALPTLHHEMRSVLGTLLDANADYSVIPDDWLFPSRKAGRDCPRCGGEIVKATVGGRTAVYCPSHQERHS